MKSLVPLSFAIKSIARQVYKKRSFKLQIDVSPINVGTLIISNGLNTKYMLIMTQSSSNVYQIVTGGFPKENMFSGNLLRETTPG